MLETQLKKFTEVMERVEAILGRMADQMEKGAAGLTKDAAEVPTPPAPAAVAPAPAPTPPAATPAPTSPPAPTPAAPAPAATPAPAAPAPVPTPAAPAPAPGAAYTYEQVQQHGQEVGQRLGAYASRIADLLKNSYHVESLTEMPAEHYASFMAALDQLEAQVRAEIDAAQA